MRKSSLRSDQRMPPRATLPPRRWHALHAWAVNEDLDQRTGQRQQVDVPARELDREIGLGLPGLVALIKVGPQRLADQQEEALQDAVLVEVLDPFQAGQDLLVDRLGGGIAAVRRGAGIELRLEQSHQRRARCG